MILLQKSDEQRMRSEMDAHLALAEKLEEEAKQVSNAKTYLLQAEVKYKP